MLNRVLATVAVLALVAGCAEQPTSVSGPNTGQSPDLTPAFSETGAVTSAVRIYFTAGGTGFNQPAATGTIERVNVDGTGQTVLYTTPLGSRPTGIAIDQQNGHVYWNDWNLRRTQRGDMDGSGPAVFIQSHPSSGLGDIALDVAGGKIYVTSGAGYRFVSRFNLDGSGGFGSIDQGFFPDGIALDLANEHVYWGDPGHNPTGIRRVDLNGANKTQLIAPTVFPSNYGCAGIGLPYHGRGRGMALDLAAGKMYFGGHPQGRFASPSCLAGNGEIWVANLNGTNPQRVIHNLGQVRDVALDLGAGKIYWTDNLNGKIQRANLDGSNIEDVLTGVLSPGGLALESNEPPVADAGDDVTVECEGDATSVTLNGTGSTDPEGGTLTYTWSAPGVTFDDPTSATPTGDFPLGTTAVTLVVTDEFGATDSDQVLVTVEDTTPPDVDLTVNPDELWPPNHKMVLVADDVSASDICCAVDLTVEVTSNEPVNDGGDGNTELDWEIVDNGDDTFDVYVRAERAGTGTDRIYTITATATDCAGNQTAVSDIVTVPHDRGKGPK